MSTDVERIVAFHFKVEDLMSDLSDRNDQRQASEYEVCKFLWDRRGSVSVEVMAQATGWSRQTIYNKWEKYGFKPRSKVEEHNA